MKVKIWMKITFIFGKKTPDLSPGKTMAQTPRKDKLALNDSLNC